jgi:Uma2 family endonuclease
MSTTILPTINAPLTPVGTSLLAAEEFADRYEGQPVELAKGVVEELPMPGPQHGGVCTEITTALHLFVKASGLGRVVSHDSWIRTVRSPDSVRGPDVFYISYERQPKGPLPVKFMETVPELVVEVRSPSDAWSKVLTKTLEYLDSKVSVVVILDPATSTAIVYRPDAPPKTLTANDNLAFPDILPGFTVNVGSLFE